MHTKRDAKSEYGRVFPDGKITDCNFAKLINQAPALEICGRASTVGEWSFHGVSIPTNLFDNRRALRPSKHFRTLAFPTLLNDCFCLKQAQV